MKLADTQYDNAETGCCARLDDAQWDGRQFEWKDKLFLKDHIRSFLHMPLNFGSVISRDLELVEQAGAYPEVPLTLTDEVSPWGADLYVALDREVPNAKLERLSGTFLSRVYDGPFRDVGKWATDFERYVESKGRRLEKTYFYYATCPKCAKAFGRNAVVLFGQVRPVA